MFFLKSARVERKGSSGGVLFWWQLPWCSVLAAVRFFSFLVMIFVLGVDFGAHWAGCSCLMATFQCGVLSILFLVLVITMLGVQLDA